MSEKPKTFREALQDLYIANQGEDPVALQRALGTARTLIAAPEQVQRDKDLDEVYFVKVRLAAGDIITLDPPYANEAFAKRRAEAIARDPKVFRLLNVATAFVHTQRVDWSE